MTRLVKVGQIVAPHGIKGMVKINTSLENPRALTQYGPIYTQTGQSMTVRIVCVKGTQVIAALDGISNRNAAENMRGTHLLINRDNLPAVQADQYYYCDLIGLTVLDQSGTAWGMVKSVENYGASDILVIETKAGADVMVAFTKETVPTVDLTNKTITVLLPDFAKEEA